MKKILLYTLLLLITACSEERESADFTLEVRNYYEETFYTVGEEQAVYLWSTKSWADGKVGTVEYVVDETVLADYNQREGTDLKVLPADCYTMSQTKFDVDDETRIAKFKVMCSPERMIANGAAYDDVTFVLPFRILVNNEPIEDRYGSVLVGFVIKKPLFQVASNFTICLNEESTDDYGLTFPYSITFPNPTWIDLAFSADAKYVTKFNQDNGTNYEAFPSAGLTYEKDQAILAKGESAGIMSLSANLELLEQGKNYLLPVVLSDVSYGMIDPDANVRYYAFLNVDKIPQSNWEAVSAGSTREGNVSKLVDDAVSSSSYWHWNWNTNISTAYVIFKLKDLTQTANVQGFEFYTRQGNTYGNRGPKAADLYTSMDGETWKKVGVMSFGLTAGNAAIQTAQRIGFAVSAQARYVKVQVTEKYDDGICFSEIYMLGEMQ